RLRLLLGSERYEHERTCQRDQACASGKARRTCHEQKLLEKLQSIVARRRPSHRNLGWQKRCNKSSPAVPVRNARHTMPFPKRRPSDASCVIIVEDDLDARQIYAEYLRSKGWNVFGASDGRIGLNKIMELLPDAVVLDLAMPKVDGWT